MKVHTEVDIPELDMLKLKEPVKEAVEKALREYTNKILEERAAFFLIDDKTLGEMFKSLVVAELNKKAVTLAEKFKPVISISST